VVAWLETLADRFFASDHGLLRLRFAARAVLSVTLAAVASLACGLTANSLLLGCVAGMVCSTSMRTDAPRKRLVNILLFAPTMGLSLTLAALLSPYRVVGDVVFLVVMFIAVYLRRFDQLGFSLGMGGFMAYFFALYLHAKPAQLPSMYLAVAFGVTSCAIMALLVFRDTPASTLRRTTLSIRAQVARLIEELARLLEDDEPLPEGTELPRAVARQAVRLHETNLQIEDSADLLGLHPRWQRQLIDAELSADRLARSTVRALGDDLSEQARAELADDLRGLHRFVDRDPSAALNLDTDDLLMRIARYDIGGDPGLLPSEPEHHVLLVRRAIQELLLAVVQMRRTAEEMLHEQPDATEEPPDGGEELRVETEPDEPASPYAGGLRPTTRSAVQAVIGGGLAILGGEFLSEQRWYWAVIAGFIVFAGTTSRGDLLVKGWRRVWGTLLGIVAGTVLATLVAGNLPLTVTLLLVCIFLAFYVLRVSYSMMTFFITVMLGMLYDILGTFTPDVLVLRLEETAIGVTGSAIAAMLILPTRTRTTVLTELHDYFLALKQELEDAKRLLVDADQVSVIAATRDVDRAANDVRTAIAPMLHRLSPSRVRRGHAARLITLTEESSLAARNLARAAEPGALAGYPAAIRTLRRLIENTDALLAASEDPPKRSELVSGPALAPTVDIRALAEANSAGDPDRIHVLHLRRIVNGLDRLDKLLLGMAAPLAATISIPRDRAHRVDQHPATRG
jgi:uncharacterized membrane protein YccC